MSCCSANSTLLRDIHLMSNNISRHQSWPTHTHTRAHTHTHILTPSPTTEMEAGSQKQTHNVTATLAQTHVYSKTHKPLLRRAFTQVENALTPTCKTQYTSIFMWILLCTHTRTHNITHTHAQSHTHTHTHMHQMHTTSRRRQWHIWQCGRDAYLICHIWNANV